jgi:Ran GTPase-activating protein (RanGAP) involved in mRNA processing and transport
VKALAANGDKFQSLQTVYLDNNQITDEGVKALAANGDKFKSLQTVHLSQNNTVTS